MKSGHYLGGFVCDICHLKKSVAGKKVNHHQCSLIRQQKYAKKSRPLS